VGIPTTDSALAMDAGVATLIGTTSTAAILDGLPQTTGSSQRG
jgi:hypothetical protein